MSIDVDIYLLVGHFYDEVVEETVESATITKYDENTGAPREVNKDKHTYKIGEYIFTDEWEAYNHLENVGLKVYEEGGEPTFIGYEICQLEKFSRIAHGLSDPISIEDIQEAINSYEERLARASLILDNPSVHIFSHVSV